MHVLILCVCVCQCVISIWERQNQRDLKVCYENGKPWSVVSFLRGRLCWLPPQFANVRSCQPCVFFALEESLVSIMSLLSSWWAKNQIWKAMGKLPATHIAFILSLFLLPFAGCLCLNVPFLGKLPLSTFASWHQWHPSLYFLLYSMCQHLT